MAMIVVLDTNIILYHLGGQLVSEIPRANFFVSAISEIELFSYHSLSPDEESTLRRFLSDTTIVDLDVTVKRLTIEVRRKIQTEDSRCNCGSNSIGNGRRAFLERSYLSTHPRPSIQIYGNEIVF